MLRLNSPWYERKKRRWNASCDGAAGSQCTHLLARRPSGHADRAHEARSIVLSRQRPMQEQETLLSGLVLIVDDSADNLTVLSHALMSDGMEVAVARDGEEAIELVSRAQPDLILLDALMPGLSGFETCRRLKADPATQGIPVIFMTALAEARFRLQGFRVGAVDYVTKPFEKTELLARVHTQISLRRATRALEERNTRLSEEIRERAKAEEALAQAVQMLRDTNERLSQQLMQSERAEAARAALQEQIIAAQRERLLELSAPLIPMIDGVLVMPLIGTVDVERAGQAVETALRGASERRADYLIIDITGVKAVDETVARMLVQAAMGLSLLGTQTVVTGIRAEVAQTFVALDLHLDQLVTKATLQSGVEHALRTRERRQRKPER
ncbi:response regulator [Sorangium sp. So ce145]|uniref:response regulator n=1 Tax=Sorangium sp. So ce145 TaxID=3133285 RepID=UPI003F5DC2D5